MHIRHRRDYNTKDALGPVVLRVSDEHRDVCTMQCRILMRNHTPVPTNLLASFVIGSLHSLVYTPQNVAYLKIHFLGRLFNVPTSDLVITDVELKEDFCVSAVNKLHFTENSFYKLKYQNNRNRKSAYGNTVDYRSFEKC